MADLATQPGFSAIFSDDLESLKDFLQANDANHREEQSQTTLLIQAAYLQRHDLVKYLASVGADLNLVDKFNQTALMYAAFVGKPRMAKILLDLGASTTTISSNNMSARDIAVKNGNPLLLQLFAQAEQKQTQQKIEKEQNEEKKNALVAYQQQLENDLTKIEYLQKKKEQQERELLEASLRRNIRSLNPKAKICLQPELDTILALEVKDLVERMSNPSLRFLLQVKTVYKFRNSHESDPYWEYKETLFNTQRTRLCFYGNSVEAISEVITQRSFSPSAFVNELEAIEGDFGYGCYFTSDSHSSALHCGKDRFLLYCEVAIGKPWQVDHPVHSLTLNELNEKGFDSVYVAQSDQTPHDQFIIYHPFQALPKYVVEFEKIEDT